MAATKIILKRSSILGKRPNTSVVEPGELALNTNATEPGLFFEVDTGDVIKVGPATVSPEPPVNNPELGETWFSTDNGCYHVGVVEEAQKVWRSVSAPFMGGGGRIVFVAPEFPYSSDSISNNGQALPFQTLTRAVIELTKNSIQDYLNGDPNTDTDRATIYLAPSRITVNNERGVKPEELQVGLENKGFPNGIYNPTISELIQFNDPDGGIILPRGISIVGMDLKKCEITPTYVPSYLHPVNAFGGENQPITSILKWSGNTYLESFSVLDKLGYRQTNRVSLAADGNAAVFHSSRPHGLTMGETVQTSYASDVNQAERSFTAGTYYAAVIDTFTFSLVEIPFGEIRPDLLFVAYSSVVPSGTSPLFRLNVENDLKSAHRLRLWASASARALSDYYEKIQLAFPDYFGGKIVPGREILSIGEYEIVGPTDQEYPRNFSSNSVQNSSAYANQVNIRSEFGLCGGEIDGDLVEGFKSAIVNSCTVISIQKDPAAYEVYANFLNNNEQVQKWWPLAEAVYYSTPSQQRPDSVTAITREQQLALLNQTSIDRIRYFYSTLKDNETGKSIGLPDVNNDFRHFGFRAINSGYMQSQSTYTIGAAVGVWALNGGYISLTNSTTNFGSVAFKAEGFRGIGGSGGAYENSKGFLFRGVQTPLALTTKQVEDNTNKTILSLGARIVGVSYDENDPGTQLVQMSGEFSACYLLPYSLKPGSAVWVASTGCTYRGFLATDGGPTIIANPGPCSNLTLRLRASDSTIPSDPSVVGSLDIPFIRRFHDPRSVPDQAYSFVVENTSSQALAPSIGSIMRLNQTSQGLVTSTLRPNVQFDPGSLGGWGRIFTVDNVQTSAKGLSPNFNYVVNDSTQDSRYIVTATLTDTAKPWQEADNNPQGEYVTYQNKNWYAAENNIWESVYFGSISNSVSPYKIPPTEGCSPFVNTSVLERQDLIEDTFQGFYAADIGLSGAGSEKYKKLSYFRGATLPYTEYGVSKSYDDDDGTDSFGMVLKQVPSGGPVTLVSSINANSVIQTEQITSQETSPARYRPDIVKFSVLSSANIPNPRQTTSIIKFSSGANKLEFFRVVNLIGSTVEAIRLNSINSMYPDPSNNGNVNKPEWASQTVGYVCVSNPEPNHSAYDPEWSSTKRAINRFFEIMGYSREALSSMTKPLRPYYWGNRVINYSEFPQSPDISGYALTTAQWPLEFNQASTVIANTHTWSFCGYPFYSQGLPKYQVNDISRKLSFDFLSTALWGGRLTVTGINDKGELVSFGPQREAVTAQFYEQETPVISATNQQIYEEQPFVEFPSQTTVFSIDNIGSGFNGSSTSFELKRLGLSVPQSQLSTNSVFVQFGAVTQIPGVNYVINGNYIQFSTAPQTGTSCDIRVVTSDDESKTLVVVPLKFVEEVDGATSTFTLVSDQNIQGLAIDEKNTFVFLGGIEQIPGVGGAYTMVRTSPTELTITFTETLPEKVTVDVRAICTGSFWSSQDKFPVSVYSLDSISEEFSESTQQKEFALKFNDQPINPSFVTTENVLVGLGGVIQIPYDSYTIENGIIKFTESPIPGTTSNLRVITNAEFLPCTNNGGVTEGFLTWGPSVILNIMDEIVTIKEELG